MPQNTHKHITWAEAHNNLQNITDLFVYNESFLTLYQVIRPEYKEKLSELKFKQTVSQCFGKHGQPKKQGKKKLLGQSLSEISDNDRLRKSFFSERWQALNSLNKTSLSREENTKFIEISQELDELSKLTEQVKDLSKNQLKGIASPPPIRKPRQKGPQTDLEAMWNAAKRAARVLWEQYTLQDLKILPKKLKQPHSIFAKNIKVESIWHEQDVKSLIADAVNDVKQEAFTLALDVLTSFGFSKENRENATLLNNLLDQLDNLKNSEDIFEHLPEIQKLNNQLMQKVAKNEKWRPLASVFFRGLALACFGATAVFPPILLVGIYCIKLSRELSSPAPKTQKMHNLSVELNRLIETAEKVRPKDTSSVKYKS